MTGDKYQVQLGMELACHLPGCAGTPMELETDVEGMTEIFRCPKCGNRVELQLSLGN